jgi:hypothetical protein
MNTSKDDNTLLALAGSFREALRHSVYLVRRLDATGELSTAQLSTLKMLLDDGVRVGGDRPESGRQGAQRHGAGHQT